jgi:hypothetical protein
VLCVDGQCASEEEFVCRHWDDACPGEAPTWSDCIDPDQWSVVSNAVECFEDSDNCIETDECAALFYYVC